MVALGRRPYSTLVRPWTDSDETVTGHFYVAAPQAPTLGHPWFITPNDQFDLRRNPYRMGEETFAVRKFDGWGRITPPVNFDHLCGTPADFAGGCSINDPRPPLVRDETGIPTCCRPLVGGVVVGGQAYVQPTPGGVVIDGTALVGEGAYIEASGGVVVDGSAQVQFYCDSYSVDTHTSGSYSLDRVPGTAAQWIDTSGKATMSADKPVDGEGNFVFVLAGVSFWSTQVPWTGAGCVEFINGTKIGSKFADVCCTD